MSDFKNKDFQKYAWDYFSVHASQRMSLFNFFVIFCSLLTTGLFVTFQESFQIHTVGIAFGILIILISFVFWKLDCRVGFLIKHAETALKEIERDFPPDDNTGVPHVTKLFTLEEYLTDQKKETSGCYWKLHLTYSVCFRIAFIAFAVIGAVGILYHLKC